MNVGAARPRLWTRRRAAWAAGGVALIGGAAGLGWAGCSIEKNYETLSFFFDGVPDPSAKQPGMPGAAVADLKDSPTYSAHKPFIEDRCDDCHGGRFKLGRKDSTLCLSCHTQTVSEHPNTHGPVAAAACLWCHMPHESAYAHLLKLEDRALCAQCHEPGMLESTRVPAHADEARSCLECHFGHGGEQRYFLKPAAGGPAPAPAGSAGGEERP